MNNGWVSHFRLSRAAFLCGILLALSGCSDNSTSSNTVDTDTYLFYSSRASSTAGPYGLMAVDPNYPSTPINLSLGPGATPITQFTPAFYLAGNVNTSNRTISDLHYAYIVNTDGTNLYRTNAVKDGGLGRIQISSEGTADQICATDATRNFVWNFTDYKNPLDSVFLYRWDGDVVAQPDYCTTTPTNDQLRLVRLSDDSGTAPRSLNVSGFADSAEEPIVPLYNSDGSIFGLLLWRASGGYIGIYDLNLTQLYSLGTGWSAKPDIMGLDGEGHIMMVFHTVSNDYVYELDPNPIAFHGPLYTGPAGSISQFFLSDGTYAYFHDDQTIRRAPYDASTNATVVSDESANFTGGLIQTVNGSVNVQDIRLSGNRLVYTYDDSTSVGGTSNQVYLRSVPKAGGTPSTIYTFAGDTNFKAWRTAAGRVYIPDANSYEAISVTDTGGSPKVYPASFWMGFTFESTTRLFSDFSLVPSDRKRDMTPKTIFRIEFTLPDGFPAKLYSYDANTTSQLIDFGSPAPTFAFYNALFSPPDNLGLTTRERTLIAFDGNSGQEILYLNARNKSTMTVVNRDNTTYVALVGINYGGGCSFGNGRFDPLLPALILLAAGYIWRRRKAWRIIHQQ